MSYFQRLVAQSRAAGVPRPVVDGVRPAAGGADIVEVDIVSDASAPAPADRATPDAASGGRAGPVSSAPHPDRGSAPSDNASDGHAVDRPDAPARGTALDRRTSAAADRVAPGLPEGISRTIDATVPAPHEGIDPVDATREREIDEPAGDSPRALGAVRRVPSWSQGDPESATAPDRAADEAPTSEAAGRGQAAAARFGHHPDPRQAIPVRAPDVGAAESASTPAGDAATPDAAAPSTSTSATRAQAGRVAFESAPRSAAPRIEVRFGRVSVEVHAAPPPPPAPIAAPVVQVVAPAAPRAFAPSRHYLRVD